METQALLIGGEDGEVLVIMRTLSTAQMAGLGEALLLPLSSCHSSNLTSHRLAAELLVGAALGACARYSDRKHSSARYQ